MLYATRKKEMVKMRKTRAAPGFNLTIRRSVNEEVSTG